MVLFMSWCALHTRKKKCSNRWEAYAILIMNNMFSYMLLYVLCFILGVGISLPIHTRVHCNVSMNLHSADIQLDKRGSSPL